MEYFLTAIKDNYLNFSGRSRRKEYWMFYLFYTIFSIAAIVIDAIIQIPLVTIMYSLGLLIPTLAIIFRRLHDTGRSAWWLLISLIPLIGAIVLFVFTLMDSTEDNRWGANPKTVA